jgi:legumain
VGVTGANPNEPSYACYWDDERETFLGDLFSIEWIEDSDSRTDLDQETVQLNMWP